MQMVLYEINRLVDDYSQCPDSRTRELILNDIKFLRDAGCQHYF
ncbi:MAG: hypothetical protein ABS934_09810 [Psychrobacillus sp.]